MSGNRILCLLFLLIWSGRTLSADTSGADFLKIDAHPYAAAAGGALVAGTGNPHQALAVANQAGLAHVTNSILALSTMPWIGGTLFFDCTWIESPGPEIPLTLGLALTGFSSLTVEQFDINGEHRGDTALFDCAASFLASLPLPVEGLSAGAAARFIIRDVYESILYGFALDLSVLWRFQLFGFGEPGFANFSLGLAIRNLGPNLAFSGGDTFSDRLPTTLSLGMRWQSRESGLLVPWLSLEMTSYANEGEKNWRFGSGLILVGTLEIVAGYRYGNDLAGVSLGTSITFPTVLGTVRLDYAFIPLADEIEPVHAFSLGLSL
ncbi:MAG TPA: hypothetical protein PK297_06800 [Spirochaetota bacterium]|nr:hypothetical protein [Spirochaetota bacterium]